MSTFFVFLIVGLLAGAALHLKKKYFKGNRLQLKADAEPVVVPPDIFIKTLANKSVQDVQLCQMMERLDLSDPAVYISLFWEVAYHRPHLIGTLQSLEPVGHLLLLDPQQKKKPS